MPRYRLKAACGWIANSTTDLGEYECDDDDDAAQTAFEEASQQIDCWGELVEDNDTQ